jgi:RNA polymerase sigma factor (TIGR02999 family)
LSRVAISSLQRQAIVPDDITDLLVAYREGDRDAFDQLVPLVHRDLRRIAHRQLARHRRGTLDTTALVHETYLKLIDQTRGTARDRAHFFALAARVMRHVIVDYARQRQAEKRGGGQAAVTLDRDQLSADDQAETVLAIDRALERLSLLNERLPRVFECRCFVGLTEQETADSLDLSLRTVQRDWMKSKAWLRTALAAG